MTDSTGAPVRERQSGEKYVRKSRQHQTDIPKYLGNVRCWVNSGNHLLAASISPFDPIRT